MHSVVSCVRARLRNGRRICQYCQCPLVLPRFMELYGRSVKCIRGPGVKTDRNIYTQIAQLRAWKRRRARGKVGMISLPYQTSLFPPCRLSSTGFSIPFTPSTSPHTPLNPSHCWTTVAGSASIITALRFAVVLSMCSLMHICKRVRACTCYRVRMRSLSLSLSLSCVTK